MAEQSRISQALGLLDKYYLFRNAYTRNLRDRTNIIGSKVFRKSERDYLKVEQEILELMGVDTGE